MNTQLLSKIHPACRNFAIVVEDLLEQRQREVQHNGRSVAWQETDWGPRTWTRTELEYMVYSSYKPMRRGRITRPPRRETVMAIADYLDCNLDERNRLLVAAELAPLVPDLGDEALQNVLQVAMGLTHHLAMPAMVINRDWHLYYFNEPLLRLYDVTAQQLADIPAYQMNLLQLLFDPRLPLYPRLIQNRPSWTRMARQSIYGFKSANTLYQFEPWYQELVAQLMSLPNFKTHWQTVSPDSKFDVDSSAAARPKAVTVDTIITSAHRSPQRAWVRPLLISVGYFQFEFPQIVAFLPADDAGQTAFNQLGVPFSQNR